MQMQCKCEFLHNKGFFLVKILYENCKKLENVNFVMKKIID